MLILLRSNSKRGAKLPEPLSVPRPKQEEVRAPMVSPLEFSLLSGLGAKKVGVSDGR